MQQGAQKRNRATAGFTIMELIAVVAILAVILAVTAPNLAVIARGTEMNRLDNYAKEIYVALSDQFVGMEATGESDQFNSTVMAAASRNLGAMEARPSDASGIEWRSYYYLTSYLEGPGSAEDDADNALVGTLGRNAVITGLVSGGRYVAEVNPRAGGTDVYAVFYSEDPDFTYEQVLSLSSRDAADRRTTGNGYPVGYYCGIAAQGGAMPDSFSPRAQFVNGEELFLNITCPVGIGLAGVESGLTVKATFSDGVASEVLTLSGGQDFTLDAGGNIDVDIVLDSMRDGMAFSDLFGSFTPGADISATVEVTYTDADGATVSTPVSGRPVARANSIYASKVGELVEVANVRHMHNLALLPDDVTSVRQVARIDFDASTWGTTTTTSLSSATQAYNEDAFALAYVNPLDPRTDADAPGFAPIEPAVSAEWTFEGQGNELRNFYVKGNGPTGLISVVRAGQIVDGVRIVDAIVEGNGPAGALAGVLEGRVSDCGVHVDVSSASDSDKQDVYLVTSLGTGAAGGLLGEARGEAVVERSYAAVDVAAGSSSATGGLVGSFSGLAVSTSYSSGAVYGSGAAGGLVGSLGAGSIQDCYSTSDVHSGSPAGGLVGNAGGDSIDECVSYGRVSAEGGGAFVGQLAGVALNGCTALVQDGYNSTAAQDLEGVEYRDFATLSSARLGADHSHPYRARLIGSSFPFAPVLDDHWGNWPDLETTPPALVYYEHYADGSYGYFGTVVGKEGDIAVNTLDETLVVLDDGYALVSSYRITGFDYSLNGEGSARATIADQPGSGSFVELPTQGEPPAYGEDVGDDVDEEGSFFLYHWDDGNIVPLDGMHVYQLPVDLLLTQRDAFSFYDMLDVTLPAADGMGATGFVFYYNPDFAKMAAGPGADGTTDLPDETGDLLVRTARQLNRIGHQPLYWTAQIVQDRDIDFGYYAADYLGVRIDLASTSGAWANRPMGSAGEPFSGSFDGRDYCIIDYRLSTDQPSAGLFGVVSGTVKNVHLAASTIGASSVERTGAAPSEGVPAVGALAGRVDGGTIEACSASGYVVRLSSSGSVQAACAGGLVGLNEGSVIRSTAANERISLDIPSASGAVLGAGGLVGGSSAAILSSYAVENELSLSTTTTGSGRTLAAGGVVGSAFEGTPSVSDCYGYGFLTTATCSPDDVVGYFGVADPSLMTVESCAYLEVGEAFEDGWAVSACDAGTLQGMSFSGMSGGTEPRYTYGETMAGHVVQASGSYPYPVVCRDSYGERAHYGFDWRE